MPWRDAVAPARMARVALVAPERSLRGMLVAIAGAGAVEIDHHGAEQSPADHAARRSRARAMPVSESRAVVPALAAEPPDPDSLERTGRFDLLAGEAELQEYAQAAVLAQGACALAGWIPASRQADLTARLAGIGCAVVPLPYPPGADALCLRAGWPRWARGLRGSWLFVGGAGLAATAFGVAYGEFFGPTGVVPALWLEPLSSPIPLLTAALAAGAVLLACAYALGTVNRWREGGWRLALYAPSGIAGSALFLGIGLAASGWYIHHDILLAVGAAVAAAGLGLALAGFAAEASGGATGAVQSTVELFDLVVRLGSNVVSFARLAAFGLTHAAVGLLVWEGTRALWHRGGAFAVLAIGLFVVGNALAFGLEALVAAIQALRLEYYELFSRVFITQGRIFRPWRVPVVTSGYGIVTSGESAPAAGVSGPAETVNFVPGKRGV